ncbi:ABC transporter permease [Prevotella cerevisiae]|uniref:ABC transporter permease n=1 Tax=Segatella cerevisiae TaxID=2053716 RepID=A0ABT1BZG4_9BACT|nr:ABC transporter permease [Segatella cerevisiae]MCO6026469.1 ABC transporter permease [Segatella cerevisiae]
MRNILNVKSYLTFLSRNKVYTLINVFGLSVSLMFVILIGVYTTQEYNVDKMHSKADRIYLLGCKEDDGENTDSVDGSNWNIQKYLKSRYPEIEKTCGLSKTDALINQPSGEKEKAKCLFVDSTFYQLLDFPLTEGDRNHVLDKLNSAVVTENFAKKLFGNANPLGKVITYNDSIHLVVTGVAQEMKGSSIDNADIIARYENMKNFNPASINEGLQNSTGAEIFILTKPNTHLENKTNDMKRYFKTFFWLYRLPDTKVTPLLIPFKKLYFSNISSSNENTLRGDKNLVNILFAVGVVILLFSIINYINLTIAQAGRRAREMATRRLLGSQRRDIALRLIQESVVLCFISLVIGILLALAAAPYVEKLLDTKLYMGALFTPAHLAILLLLMLLTGILSGIAPALFISREKPIEVVRGTFLHQTKMVFSKFLIIFQSTITMVLTGVSLTMVLQVHHLTKAPLGYQRNNIIGIDNLVGDSAKSAAFLNTVKQLPCVKNASACCGYPLNRGNNNTLIYQGKSISFQIFTVDDQFMKIFGIPIEQDYHLDDENGCYINRQAYRELGLKPGVRHISIPNYNLDIRGIFRDFHIGDITEEQHPTLIFVKKALSSPWNFVIQVTGNPVEAYRQIQKVYKDVFHLDLDSDHPFIDQQIEEAFDQQIRMSKIISLFAGIAILISLLGLVAMSTYFIQQRNKEIAVRKVFGSDSRQMLVRLVRTFLSYVLVAFVLSVPVIWYFMSDWLSGYSYRIALSPWIFLVSGLFCMAISISAVFIQSYRASHENPILHIKEN